MKRPHAKKKRAFFLALGLAVLLVAAGPGLRKRPGPAAVALEPVARPEWDRVFARTAGWTGGDVAASFLIHRGRVLWVFGDSLVGEVEGDRRARFTLVNNAIAILLYDPLDPGAPPAAEKVKFYWGPPDASGQPTAWIKPFAPDGRPFSKSRAGQSTSSAETPRPTWFWPTGGGLCFPGPAGVPRLALFLIQLEKASDADAVWGFRCVGSAVAIISDAAAPADHWRPRVISLPHEISRSVKESKAVHQVDWGVAALLVRAFAPAYIYIYGVELNSDNTRDLVLARVRPADLEDFSDWQFFTGAGWQSSPDLSEAVAHDVASELSVDRVMGPTGAGYVMVSSEPRLGDRILVRTAARPEGPWSEARAVFRIPEVQGSRTRFAYAAKGHAALSEPGTLLVSYVVNSNDFLELANNAAIYRPRFISVRLGAVFFPTEP